MKLPPEILNMQLTAWVGEDEFIPGSFGLKQGIVPAGRIPIVSVDPKKLEKYWPQAEAQAANLGKKIYLCRFKLVEVMQETNEGE